MKRHLENFVSKELFPGRRPPPKTRRRFYPSNKDLTNYMQRAKHRQRHSKINQENLQILLEKWKTESPDDFFFFRQKEKKENDGQADEKNENLLFCYQSKNQQYLLKKYGNEMCLLDATYRTTRYALPLFFLCVRTNVSYEVVGVFISQNENSDSIAEALHIICKCNPDWNPKYFMVDFDSAEILALEDVFPGMFINKQSHHWLVGFLCERTLQFINAFLLSLPRKGLFSFNQIIPFTSQLCVRSLDLVAINAFCSIYR